MKEVKKLNINDLVSGYISKKDEAVLEKCYRDLLREYQAKLSYWSSTTFMANHHEINTLFDDAFLSSLKDIEAKGGDFVKLFHCKLTNRYKTLLRDLTTRRKRELYDQITDGEKRIDITGDKFNYFENLINKNNTEDTTAATVLSKQKDDQRQLIDFLVRGENERTTAIVQAYLSTDLKTPTAIGNYLGLDHKQVSRALNRLAAKFSTKQFGNYEDYLIAL